MKTRVYAKSVGDKNACILLNEGDVCPSGHTEIKPLDPQEGKNVVWVEAENKWEYQEIIISEEELDPEEE